MLRAVASSPQGNGGGIAGLKSVGAFGGQTAAQTVTGTTTPAVLGTFTVPGKTTGIGGGIRITAQFSYTNSAGIKTPRITFGGTQIFTISGGAQASCSVIKTVRNRTLTSQIADSNGGAGTGTSSGGSATLALDTTVDQTIIITGTLNTITDSLTLEYFLVEVINL